MWKSTIFGEGAIPVLLRRWIRASIFFLLLSTAAFFCHSAFFSATGGGADDDEIFLKNPTILSSPSPSPSVTPTDLSHVIFGIAGSARTWQTRKSYSELWWDPLRMRGHVWFDSEPSPSLSTWPSTCPPFRVSTDASRFGDRASASRIARIVAESYNIGMDDVRWFVMGDDDTVFFPENLVAVLGKYDHREMYYVGAPSESVEQDVIHSYGMAFGGGGFAISLPAAAALAPAIDSCLDRYSRFWGSDQRVMYCLAELGVPLTREPGFHQVDLRGDPYGMLASHPITPLVSLHHLDYVEPIFPTGPNQVESLRILVQASRFDPARTLQQTFCYYRGGAWDPLSFNWSVSVSWGYTVQIYPFVLFPKELQSPLRTFQTWRSFQSGPFIFETREPKPEQECERPELFFLDGVKLMSNRNRWNGTMTEYSRFEKPPMLVNGPKCEQQQQPGYVAASRIRSVRVFAGPMDPVIWQKAPRRQCCDARVRKRGSSMDVRIRDCYPGEITSPP